MSERMHFYNKDFSRSEQIKWLIDIELKILTNNIDMDDHYFNWTLHDLEKIQDSLLALDQMTDETYEEKKTEYWEYIYEDALADHMMDMAFLEEISGIND
jgi:hypothetical protein